MKLKVTVVLLFLACLCLVLIVKPASAYTFNPNDLIDDGVFYDTGTMGFAQIDNFLNTFPNSCISPKSGFSAPDPTGYNPTNGFLYGKSVSAGQVIYDAALSYGLNPQVLLTTLEKEEGLVDGTGTYGCSTTAIASAVGYGCPDGGTLYNYSGVDLYSTGTTFDSNFNVVNSGTAVTSINGTCVDSSYKVGFSQQIIHATWLLRFGQERSKGNINWDVQLTNYPQPGDAWDNSDDPQSCYSGPMTQGTWQRCPSGGSSYYDGYTTIDNSGQCAGLPTSLSVHMDTGATAALYWYTPHICGNYNFFNIFTGWFGSTQSPSYAGQPVWQQVYTDSTGSTPLGWGANLMPGQTAYVVVVMKNVGNITWTRSGGAGTTDTRLATYGPWGRQSDFCTADWIPTVPACTRPAILSEATVAPGSTGTFQFSIKAPESPGVYNENFGLVIDGLTTFSTGTVNIPITVVNPSDQPIWQQVYTDSSETNALGWNASLTVGQSAYAIVAMKNTSGAIWRSSDNIMLGTELPQDRNSSFCANSWLFPCKRTALMNESSVAPGQVATFQFPITAPNQAGTYNETLGLVINGFGYFTSGYMNFRFVVNPITYTAQPVWQQIYTDSTRSTSLGWNATLTAGQGAYAVVAMKNTSNFTWTQSGGAGNTDVRLATYGPWGRQSQFCTVAWIPTAPSCTRPAALKEPSVAPGQIGTFEFPIAAPSQAGLYNESFGLVVDGKTVFSNGYMNVQLTVQ